jgi:hypothetical protein
MENVGYLNWHVCKSNRMGMTFVHWWIVSTACPQCAPCSWQNVGCWRHKDENTGPASSDLGSSGVKLLCSPKYFQVYKETLFPWKSINASISNAERHPSALHILLSEASPHPTPSSWVNTILSLAVKAFPHVALTQFSRRSTVLCFLSACFCPPHCCPAPPKDSLGAWWMNDSMTKGLSSKGSDH